MENLILEEIKNFVEQVNKQKDVLSLSEAAKYLDVSNAQLYRLTSTNSIPYYKPSGKKIYFRKQELNDWVFGSKIAPSSEIEDKASNYIIKKGRVA